MDFQKLSLEKGIIYLFNKEHSRYTRGRGWMFLCVWIYNSHKNTFDTTSDNNMGAYNC